ncbi:hypothetical protein ACLOJK_023019 [Asimina triloba]
MIVEHFYNNDVPQDQGENYVQSEDYGSLEDEYLQDNEIDTTMASVVRQATKNYRQQRAKKKAALAHGDISQSINNNEPVSVDFFKGQENHTAIQFVVSETAEKVMDEENIDVQKESIVDTLDDPTSELDNVMNKCEEVYSMLQEELTDEFVEEKREATDVDDQAVVKISQEMNVKIRCLLNNQ